jgi:hypothetical protein
MTARATMTAARAVATGAKRVTATMATMVTMATMTTNGKDDANWQQRQ